MPRSGAFNLSLSAGDERFVVANLPGGIPTDKTVLAIQSIVYRVFATRQERARRIRIRPWCQVLLMVDRPGREH